MSHVRVVISEKQVQRVRGILKGAVALTLLSLAFSGFRLAGARMRKADMADQIRMQENTLKNLKESIKNRPVEPLDARAMTGNSVAHLQAQLERAATAQHCRVTEFQASPDREPYICVFTLDTNQKNWEQVSIHVSLQGSLAATLTTVGSLARCGIPVEPDSIEISRQWVTQQGSSDVTVRLDLRALIQAGGKA